MPRDATATRERLLVEAERVFAEQGVDKATTQEITRAAEQRNASALTYHFGSRAGVLAAILRRHGDPMDLERAALAGDRLAERTTRELVAALLVPYGARLATESGRRYLRIVVQLADRFPVWQLETDLSPPHLRRILGELQHRVEVDEARAEDRVVGAIILMTVAIAERARAIDADQGTTLDHGAFLANLADMIVALLEAPGGPALIEQGP